MLELFTLGPVTAMNLKFSDRYKVRGHHILKMSRSTLPVPDTDGNKTLKYWLFIEPSTHVF
jgi:hypothetical protein